MKEYCETDGCCSGQVECGCGNERRFFTKEEKLKMLSDYKEALQKEMLGVEEKMTELKAK